jgi:signal peptidase I
MSDESTTDVSPRRRSSLKKLIFEFGITALIAVIASGLISSFVVSGFYIPSASMQNTLKIGDRILVWRPYNLTGGLQRGDVIVFRDPGKWLSPALGDDSYLVKRIIGLPGDKVECCDATNSITINGKRVVEDYIKDPGQPSLTTFSVTVPKNKLWVMGDNRANSDDSRYQTPHFVDMSDVIGVAFVKFWPKFMQLPDESMTFDGVTK